jgi:hypothetical protein
MMNETPKVSIIINNYNYGRFLAAAIDSALAQSYPSVEVVVVDDGSADDSRATILSYGQRIVPVLKPNGGQASALNAGLERSSGDIIIFLDADDTLHPTIAERVVALFQAAPDVVRVQYRLALVDAARNELGETKPPRQMAIPSGDLRHNVILHGDDMPWLPTSGNAFSAAMLRRIFPIPEAPYRICADYYLSNLSPLFGRLAALEEIGGYYRVHGANNHETARLDIAQTRQLVARTQTTHQYLAQFARELGLPNAAPDIVASRSLTFIANQLILRRLDETPQNNSHSAFALAHRGIIAAWRRSDLSLLLRLLYTLWFMLAATMPKGLTRWLAEQFFYPQARGQWFNDLLATLRRVRQAPKLQP